MNLKGYYIIDLGSTHGTFLNKTRIEPNKYVRVNVESMIKFGLSTRLYLLHGPKSKNNSDDLKINLTHEQMRRIKDKYDQISIKLKVRKEIEEEEKLEEERIGTKNRVTWGMSENVDEENNPDEENPFAVIEEEDESFYSADPRKALKNL
jgi:pSer/pThr/pTyr-binding forkhead associated (FHA) protein